MRASNYVRVTLVFVCPLLRVHKDLLNKCIILLHSVSLSFGKHIIKKKTKECANSGCG